MVCEVSALCWTNSCRISCVKAPYTARSPSKVSTSHRAPAEPAGWDGDVIAKQGAYRFRGDTPQHLYDRTNTRSIYKTISGEIIQWNKLEKAYRGVLSHMSRTLRSTSRSSTKIWIRSRFPRRHAENRTFWSIILTFTRLRKGATEKRIVERCAARVLRNSWSFLHDSWMAVTTALPPNGGLLRVRSEIPFHWKFLAPTGNFSCGKRSGSVRCFTNRIRTGKFRRQPGFEIYFIRSRLTSRDGKN